MDDIVEKLFGLILEACKRLWQLISCLGSFGHLLACIWHSINEALRSQPSYVIVLFNLFVFYIYASIVGNLWGAANTARKALGSGIVPAGLQAAKVPSVHHRGP